MGKRFEVASVVYDEFMYDLGYLDFVKKEMGRKLVDSIFTALKAGEKIVKLSDYEYLQNTPDLRTEIRQHIDITELIRCQDCKYWEYDTIFSDGCCRGKHQGNPNWFCADGERKE